MPAPAEAFPMRYVVREEENERYLTCREAPEIRVFIDASQSVSESTARRAPEGTIFLDGAARGAPFIDAERRVFNLDHHEGCVRGFTVATCEQALVLVLRGLDMGGQPWTIRASAPDLDAVLAVWVLLNAMHLGEAGSLPRERIIPLVRLESVIDAHGLAMRELAGLPAGIASDTAAALDALRKRELELKEAGPWDGLDPLSYTGELLASVDRLIYPPGFFEEVGQVEVAARFPIGRQRVGLVCRSEEGIYEVEKRLKRLYGKRLGLIALEREPGAFTLRQVDPFLPIDLETVYEELNVLDPAVVGGGKGNRWGGSGEIGGSPRETGTRLSPKEIAEACGRAYRKPSRVERAAAAGVATAAVAGCLGAAWLAMVAAAKLFPTRLAAPLVAFVAVVLAGSTVALLAPARRRPRLFGLQLPRGRDWLYPAPLALVGALAGGVWGPVAGRWEVAPGLFVLLALTLPAGAELLFRGLAHGILGRRFRIGHAGGHWFLSSPAAVSALLYATTGVWVQATVRGLELSSPVAFLLPFSGLLLFGLVAGLVRERAGSLVAPYLLHLAMLAACLALARWIPVPGAL